MRGHTPQSGQEKKFEKTKKVLDKPHKVWYNKGVKGRNEEIHRKVKLLSGLRKVPKGQNALVSRTLSCPTTLDKKKLRVLKKPLDKPHKVWYNTSVPKERIRNGWRPNR